MAEMVFLIVTRTQELKRRHQRAAAQWIKSMRQRSDCELNLVRMGNKINCLVKRVVSPGIGRRRPSFCFSLLASACSEIGDLS